MKKNIHRTIIRTLAFLLITSVAFSVHAQSHSTAVIHEDTTFYKIPKLEVLVPTGPDSETQATYRLMDAPEVLVFRWSHELVNVRVARYDVFRSLSGGPFISISSSILPEIPQPNAWGTFNLDLLSLDNISLGIPRSWMVRVSAYTLDDNLWIQAPRLIAKSQRVRIDITGAKSPSTAFSLPTLRVNVEKVIVHDDSDDLSDGELGFAFWVEFSGQKTPLQIHHDTVSSGGQTTVNKTVTVENPPSSVLLSVYGFDDDENEMLPLLMPPFFISVLGTCGQLPQPEPSAAGNCPKDESWGQKTLTLGYSSSIQNKPFSIIAAGSSGLHFEVRGNFEVIVP